MTDQTKSKIELAAEVENLRQRVAELEAQVRKYSQIEETLARHQRGLLTNKPPLKEAPGKITGVVDISQDITDARQAREAEAISRELFQRLIHQLPIGVEIFDLQGFTIGINQALMDIFGITEPEKVIGHFNLFTDPMAAQTGTQAAGREALAGRIVHLPEVVFDFSQADRRFNQAQGRRILTVTFFPIRNALGEVVQIVALNEDITEQKHLQLELARFRAMMDQAGEAILVIDPPTGRVVDVNETACRLLGYTREEMVLLSVMDIGADEPYPQDKWLSRVERIKQAQAPLLVEGLYKRKDRTIFPVEVIASYRNFEGQDYILVLARDLSQLARLEAQLRQAQKLEAVGQLAAGVAHNFNNMLTAITGYAGLALDNLADPHPVRSDLEGIQRTAQRAANLIQQLLAFTRSQIIQPRLLDLNELVIRMNPVLRQLISEPIELELSLAPDLGRVKVDPEQFEQVIVHLVVNARDAMPEGGKLTLSTANVTLDQHYTNQYAELVPGNYVRLSVTDTGTGMTSEVKEHIFEPFFTTKEVGKGTGLGLATCFGIIKQSQGHIIVSSEPNQGTTFEIYLPRSDELARTSMGEANYSLRGTETILLVEDEREAREMAAQILRRHGYTVLEAAGGAEAIQLVKAQPETSIHLLLVDVVMPGIKGGDLANHIKRLHPLMKVLFISGYLNDFYAHQETLAPEVDLLLKPFLPIALVQKVRQILDQE